MKKIPFLTISLFSLLSQSIASARTCDSAASLKIPTGATLVRSTFVGSIHNSTSGYSLTTYRQNYLKNGDDCSREVMLDEYKNCEIVEITEAEQCSGT